MVTPNIVDFESKKVTIHHEMFLTMIDTKTINVLENNTASSVIKNTVIILFICSYYYYIFIKFYLLTFVLKCRDVTFVNADQVE